VARDQEQENAREELGQADEAEIQRPLRDFVDLPADRDRLHLPGKYDEETRQLEKNETGISKSDSPGGSGILGCSHRALLCHKTKTSVRTVEEMSRLWFASAENF
jgi:hypothetical protein